MSNYSFVLFSYKFNYYLLFLFAGRRRKVALMDNSAYLQFMWKADVVEIWFGDKEKYVRSEEFGRDLSTVQTLLTKQEIFDASKLFFLCIFDSLFFFIYLIFIC